MVLAAGALPAAGSSSEPTSFLLVQFEGCLLPRSTGHTVNLSADGEIRRHRLLDTMQTNGLPLSSAHGQWAPTVKVLLNLHTEVMLFQTILRRGQGIHIPHN